MPRLRHLADDATLNDIYDRYPEIMFPYAETQQALMRGPSSFTAAQREVIAAYVSALNGCRYCFGGHSAVALEFGVPEELLTALLEAPDDAPVDDDLKPILAYVRKLTESPSKMVQADADAVYAAGWDDTALFHAIAVCASFNFANRIVDGVGLVRNEATQRAAARRLATQGYSRGRPVPE